MPFVKNGTVRIRYQVYGDGEPLVLIHGWSCEGRYWDEFGYVSRLRDRFKIIVPDLRGHGDSDTPADRDFTDRAFASDIVAVLQDTSDSSAHLFGYSLGGWVVFELAVNDPSAIRTAIVGGAHPYAEDLSMVRHFGPSDLLALWDAAGAPLSDDSKSRIRAFTGGQLAEMIPDRRDTSGLLSNWRTPLLMISGTKDWRFEDMKRFAAARADTTFVPLEGADHGQTWLRSDRIVPEMRRFLGGMPVLTERPGG